MGKGKEGEGVKKGRKEAEGTEEPSPSNKFLVKALNKPVFQSHHVFVVVFL